MRIDSPFALSTASLIGEMSGWADGEIHVLQVCWMDTCERKGKMAEQASTYELACKCTQDTRVWVGRVGGLQRVPPTNFQDTFLKFRSLSIAAKDTLIMRELFVARSSLQLLVAQKSIFFLHICEDKSRNNHSRTKVSASLRSSTVVCFDCSRYLRVFFSSHHLWLFILFNFF